MDVASRHDTHELLRLAIGPACHELRSPLAVVYGFARMLEGDDSLDERGRSYMAHVVRGAERLDQLLDALSELGRISAGRARPVLEQVPLEQVVNDVAGTGANADRVTVEAGPSVQVRADPTWLASAIADTIDALCFEEGIDVRITWRSEDDDVRLHVLPNSSYPLVDTEPEKSGLGLSLARMRAVAMGGDLVGDGDRVVMSLQR